MNDPLRCKGGEGNIYIFIDPTAFVTSQSQFNTIQFKSVAQFGVTKKFGT